ncbi:MAG: hypothetical protein KA144_05155 [Xanthomonadaceae bacterium]|nr:hypothetical protein [Xanthomonadaceae bacterium]
MNKTFFLLPLGALALVLCAGCTEPTPESSTPATDTAAQTAPPATEPTAEPAPSPAPQATSTKPADPIAQADLRAGLDAMTPRIVATVDAYQKIAAREDARLTMHPDADKNAVVEFDVDGLRSLTLSPYMGDFSSVPDCEGNPDAGVAQMRWSLDGGVAEAATVDRHYASTIAIEFKGAKRLKVEVDKGNNVHWCDWLGLGIANVQ